MSDYDEIPKSKYYVDDAEIPLEDSEAIKILKRIQKDCKLLKMKGYTFQDCASNIVLTDRDDRIRGTLY